MCSPRLLMALLNADHRRSSSNSRAKSKMIHDSQMPNGRCAKRRVRAKLQQSPAGRRKILCVIRCSPRLRERVVSYRQFTRPGSRAVCPQSTSPASRCSRSSKSWMPVRVSASTKRQPRSQQSCVSCSPKPWHIMIAKNGTSI